MANKIKRTTTPVAFHDLGLTLITPVGGSAVRLCHSLQLLCKTIPCLWEGIYWTWAANRQTEKEKKKKKRVSYAPSSSNTTGGLFNGVPRGGRSKRAKHVSLEEKKKGGKWCWLWSLHCFSSSHEWGVRWFLLGVRLTFWFRCCTFDFDVNPCNFPPGQKKRVSRHSGGGALDFALCLASHCLALCLLRPF